jgi:hypothetical protein
MKETLASPTAMNENQSIIRVNRVNLWLFLEENQ